MAKALKKGGTTLPAAMAPARIQANRLRLLGLKIYGKLHVKASRQRHCP